MDGFYETLKAWDADKAKAEYNAAAAVLADRWVPAAAGTEVPFLRNGKATLYVFNPGTFAHGYLDLATDVVEEEA